MEELAYLLRVAVVLLGRSAAVHAEPTFHDPQTNPSFGSLVRRKNRDGNAGVGALNPTATLAASLTSEPGWKGLVVRKRKRKSRSKIWIALPEIVCKKNLD